MTNSHYKQPPRWIVEEVFRSDNSTLIKITQNSYNASEEWPKPGQELHLTEDHNGLKE